MFPTEILKEPFLICKDHTVSGEQFELRKAEKLDLFVTFPRPEEDKLSSYYKSEKYISHTDSKSTFFDRIYQLVKSSMLKKKLVWIEKEVPKKGNILDLGAGTGDFLLAAKKRGWEVFGVEPDNGARKLAAEKGVDLLKESEALPNEFFDVISMWHVLEHVPDLDKQISELQRLLKPDGLLLIAVPNFKSYDAKVYKENWAAYDVPRHLYHFSPQSMRELFEKKNFSLTSQKGLFFDSFYVSLLSEKYRSAATNVVKALMIGFISNLRAMKDENYSSLAYFFRKSQKGNF
ncbi:class I SAM-dependent methyltransferase [Salinimicrobium oceani]|uniref:Class I SAM-dependent methyltransferase n=1 Tax=Salinimicrobium oceani TaxID=2722702 RepID=A0ABX1CUL7_9FLAO|nr:class I SAM-dependent methyltransferase [Salinimicrobium oceani]NJW51980.1 class I SAM-dependent methyltransferase [Salinimicrobium oceani]